MVRTRFDWFDNFTANAEKHEKTQDKSGVGGGFYSGNLFHPFDGGFSSEESLYEFVSRDKYFHPDGAQKGTESIRRDTDS